MRSLLAQPITATAFAPFGQVVEHDRSAVVYCVGNAFERDETATTPSLSLLRLETAFEFPITVDTLERHPHAAQTFLALKGGRSLIVVCGSTPNGNPSIATAKAFIAEPHHGIIYQRNVWHRSVTPLEAPSEYAMMMMRHPAGSDTELFDLREKLSVVL